MKNALQKKSGGFGRAARVKGELLLIQSRGSLILTRLTRSFYSNELPVKPSVSKRMACTKQKEAAVRDKIKALKADETKKQCVGIESIKSFEVRSQAQLVAKQRLIVGLMVLASKM